MNKQHAAEDCGSDPAWIAAVFKQMGPSAEADLHKYTQMLAHTRAHTHFPLYKRKWQIGVEMPPEDHHERNWQ